MKGFAIFWIYFYRVLYWCLLPFQFVASVVFSTIHAQKCHASLERGQWPPAAGI